MQSLALYLRDWLSNAPGVLLMDLAQYDALLDDVMNPSLVWAIRPTRWHCLRGTDRSTPPFTSRRTMAN